MTTSDLEKIKEYCKKWLPIQWRDKELSDLKGDYSDIIKIVNDWDYKTSISLVSRKNGVGKTHIAICILKKYLDNRFNSRPDLQAGDCKCYFYKERQIYYEVLQTYKKDSNESENDILKKYCSLPFLIIDDLFSNKQNEFARRVILDIVDERIDWRGLPTVITSNLSTGEIGDIDTRIISRLSSGIVYTFDNRFKDNRII